MKSSVKGLRKLYTVDTQEDTDSIREMNMLLDSIHPTESHHPSSNNNGLLNYMQQLPEQYSQGSAGFQQYQQPFMQQQPFMPQQQYMMNKVPENQQMYYNTFPNQSMMFPNPQMHQTQNPAGVNPYAPEHYSSQQNNLSELLQTFNLNNSNPLNMNAAVSESYSKMPVYDDTIISSKKEFNVAELPENKASISNYKLSNLDDEYAYSEMPTLNNTVEVIPLPELVDDSSK
jgi:hypothetical protein